MKAGRIEGRLKHSQYVIRGPQGVMKEIPLDQAREDPKLAAAIQRNRWGSLDGNG